MVGIFGKFRNLTSALPKSRIIFVLAGLVLLLAVPLTVFVAQQQQQTKQHASFTNPASNFSSFTKGYQQAIAEKAIDPARQILEVSLSYDEVKDPKVSVSETRILNGYVPYQFANLNSNTYTLQELDENSIALYKTKFEIPNDIHVDPNPDGTITAPVHTELKQVDFIQTIPYYSKANSIMILDPQGKTIAVKFLKDTPRIDNKPDFKLINGEDIVKLQKTDNSVPGMGVPKLNMNNILPFSNKAFAQEKNRAVNIVVIGDNYKNNFNLFHKDAETHSSYLLTLEPFRTRASQLNFIYIDNSEDLMCYKGSFCNIDKVIRTVDSKGVPYDVVMVIVNDIAHGGAIPPIGVVGGANIGGAKEAFAHELAHAFVRLKDEYTYDNPVITEKEGNRVYANCFWGTPPAPEWSNLVGVRDYAEGCAVATWHRSSNSSILIDTSEKYFNAVSQKIINEKISQIAGPFTEDKTSPQVQFISPNSNSTLSKGTIAIKAQATDDRGIAYVQLWADGVFLKTSYVAPYDLVWDASADKEGQHTLQIKAYDVSGNLGQAEKEYILTINNNMSKVKITLRDDLKEGMVVGRAMQVEIKVPGENKNSISKIESFVDDKLEGTVFHDALMKLYEENKDKQYGFWVDPKKYFPGSHKFYARVYNDTGGIAVSNTITFNVVNSSFVAPTSTPNPTPTPKLTSVPVSISSTLAQPISDIKVTLGGDLKEGMTVDKPTRVDVKVSEADKVHVSKIESFVDDKLMNSVSSDALKEIWGNTVNPKYGFWVWPNGYPNGDHKFYAKVYDDTGAVVTSDTIGFNIANIPTTTPKLLVAVATPTSAPIPTATPSVNSPTPTSAPVIRINTCPFDLTKADANSSGSVDTSDFNNVRDCAKKGTIAQQELINWTNNIWKTALTK